MNTFSLSTLRDVLIKRNAFIYHGAGVAKGVGNAATNSLLYLDRFRRVITEDLEVCCSTIKFGDSEHNFNFWGKMGLILWPQSANSITFVSPRDAGTEPDPSNPGRRQIWRAPITSQALVESIDLRATDAANEWCVFDYTVVGIFIEPPIQFVENGALRDLEVADVFRAFPTMRVFAFYCGQLREVLPPARWGALLTISELYPGHNAS